MPATPAPGPSARRASPNIAWQRPEYVALLPLWTLIRDCLSGSRQVKHAGDHYLPRPNPTDLSEENKKRYEQYLQRAVFYGVTKRTLDGLVGQVMTEDPVIKLPDVIAMLEHDVDGGGVSLTQQMTKALSIDTAYGRGGLLVDYPVVEGAVTQADLADGDVRPTIMLVEPWEIINWRVRQVGGQLKLSLLVISEKYVTVDDGFEQTWAPQWRVLYLDEDDLVVVEEWIIDPQNDKEFIIKPLKNGDTATQAQYLPTDSSGARLDCIPFKFFGALNNDPSPDLPPLYDLAELNIAHYRNSADYEEACYIAGQPTPVLSGLTESWVTTVLKGSVQLGSRAAVPLPPGGTASMLQATENSMPKEAMDTKEKQMVALGAKLVQQQVVQRTATEAMQDRAAETSVLAMIANNVSEAYECALCMALAYVDVAQVPSEMMDVGEDDSNADEVIEVELNTNFVANRMNAQERAQLVAEWQSGAITDGEMRRNLTRAGIASDDFDKWKEARDAEALTKPIMAMPSAMPGKPGMPSAQGGPIPPT